MFLMEKEVDFKQCLDRDVFFVIDQFMIPAQLESFTIHLEKADCSIATLLIYDSRYQLRFQMNNVNQLRRIRISEKEQDSSIHVKAGEIPQGQWVMALELPRQETPNVQNLSYFIEIDSKSRV